MVLGYVSSSTCCDITLPYLIGIDEAGYGPNLGPLVVCATVWRVPEGLVGGEAACDLYRHLADAVAASPCADRLAIADSKLLYGKGKGLRLLEEGIWSLGPLVEHAIPFWTEAEFLDADPADLAPWYQAPGPVLPQSARPEVIRSHQSRFQAACEASEVRLCRVAVAAVTAGRFNRQLARWGKKSDVLSHATLELLRRCLAGLSEEPAQVVCDKHGGRNRYAALLQHHFPQCRIATEEESRPASRYRLEGDGGDLEIQFRSQGEGFLPAALASMFAKYHRELAMAAFNQFWISHLPALRPTAGYPLDARRFAEDVAVVREELRITASDFWREK